MDQSIDKGPTLWSYPAFDQSEDLFSRDCKPLAEHKPVGAQDFSSLTKTELKFIEIDECYRYWK